MSPNITQTNPVTPIDRSNIPVQIVEGNGYPNRPRPIAWVSEYTGLTKQTIYQFMKEGPDGENSVFPRPIKLGARKVAWVESEVLEWVADRARASRSA